jgi:hypothetical protein
LRIDGGLTNRLGSVNITIIVLFFVVSLVEFPNRFGTSKHVGDHKVINSWPFNHHNVGLHRLRQENGVDGRIPAPVDRWFIPLFIFIYRVSTVQGGAGFLPSTIC